jgi:hypothetical protein
MTDSSSMPRGTGTLDDQALAKLRELDPTGANRLLERVANAFLSSTPELLAQLESVRNDSPDMATIRRVAHTLKSSCANIGALAMSRRCAEIEQLAHQGQAQPLAALLDGLGSDWTEVHEALTNLLAEPRPE